MGKNSIKIKGKEFNVKEHSYRAFMLFEDMTGKLIQSATTFEDGLKYFYCLVKASNTDFEYDFDEWVDILEEDPSILYELREILDKKKRQII